MRPKSTHNYAYTKKQKPLRQSDFEKPAHGGDGNRCWCGEKYQHGWEGKEDGAPHPTKDNTMKVKVEYTVEVSDDYRRAIVNFYGGGAKATYTQVKDWLVQYGTSMDDEIMQALEDKKGLDAK